MKRLALALAIAVSAIGCKQVEFKNGEVPAEYMEQAKKLEGVYQGSLAGEPYELTIKFDGQKPRLTIVSPKANGCLFDLGKVLSADVSEDKDNNTILKTVYFELNSESCFRAEGKEMEIDVAEVDGHLRLDTYLLVHEYWERVCRWEDNPPGYPPPPPGYPGGPRYVCRDQLRKEYLNGRFTR